MFIGDYKFWLMYHKGYINRELTDKEYSEIRASEFAMHLLIPTKMLLKRCKGYENLKKIYDTNNLIEIAKLSNDFQVPIEVMWIKMKEIVTNHKATIISFPTLRKSRKLKPSKN